MGLEESSECEMGFGMAPWSALEKQRLALLRGGAWITWSFGQKVTVCKGSRKRCCPSSSSLKQNMRVVLAGSGEEVKLGENLLGYG